MPPNGVSNGNHAAPSQIFTLFPTKMPFTKQDIIRDPGSTKALASIISSLSFNMARYRSRLSPREGLPAAPEYLRFRTKHVSKLNAAVFVAEYRKVNALFERALILLNKMPRIWEMYLKFLLQQPPRHLDETDL
ncbi:putative pre-mRNA-splicing factor SYF1 [Rosellinia necatrix]|uniref:Putative pre-mRNA-splicing factor SYF1 n=1 Tax=Rosellinia necatrix TaxID=77044 RepID=A0A1S8AAP9_ROSNE|nr:putative pre-mRNA-splicing factor SYF1 [Rosellinia necatrix]